LKEIVETIQIKNKWRMDGLVRPQGILRGYWEADCHRGAAAIVDHFSGCALEQLRDGKKFGCTRIHYKQRN
jgi:hypothetical protein